MVDSPLQYRLLRGPASTRRTCDFAMFRDGRPCEQARRRFIAVSYVAPTLATASAGIMRRVSELPSAVPGPASADTAPVVDGLKVSGVQAFLRGP